MVSSSSAVSSGENTTSSLRRLETAAYLDAAGIRRTGEVGHRRAHERYGSPILVGPVAVGVRFDGHLQTEKVAPQPRHDQSRSDDE